MNQDIAVSKVTDNGLDGQDFYSPHGMGLSLFGTTATFGLLYQPQVIDDDDCGAVS
jgi:hypothetical protein